jgi:single-strand DNA-binding protein
MTLDGAPITSKAAGTLRPRPRKGEDRFMAEGLNRVMLLGNLGADPERRSTSGGQAVLKFRLATTESYLDRNKTRQDRTEWHNIVVWGKRAEALSRILNKGSRLFIEGSLRTSSYEDRDGNKKYRTEIHAQNIVLCGGRGGGGSRDAGPEYDDEPGGSPAPATGFDDGGFGGGGSSSGGDDEFPF